MTPWILAVLAASLWIGGWYGAVRFIQRNIRMDRDTKAISELESRARTEAAILDTMRRHPRSVHPALAWADLATAAGDKPEALRRAETLCRMFPKSPDAQARNAGALLRLGRTAEADGVAANGLRRWPRSMALATQWIEAARSTGDVETALARAKAIRRKAPKERAGYTYAISVLLAQNRLEEAAELNEAGHGAVPDGLGPDYDGTLAQIAERRNDWKKASEIWLAAIEKAPRLPHLHLAAIRATRASGDQAAADTLLTRAFAMFSYDNSIKAEHDHRFPDVAGSADTGRTAAS